MGYLDYKHNHPEWTQPDTTRAEEPPERSRILETVKAPNKGRKMALLNHTLP